MPFSPRVIETREDIPEIFQGNATKVLEKANVSNMIGLLEQLNQVSKFASEVFADILKDTEKNSQRIKDCRTRISRIDTKVAPIEKMFVERAPSYFYDNPFTGKEWKRRDALKGLIFRRDRSSMEVNRRRNEADPPPNLSALDNYSLEGPCIKKFTDSNFFMNEWMEAEKKKIEEEKAKRKARKRKKKKKREQKKTIQRIKVKKFDPVTGKMIEVEDEVVAVKQFTLTGDVMAKDIEYGGDDEKKSGPPKPMGKSSIMKRGGGNNNNPPPNPVKKGPGGPGGPPPNPMLNQKKGPPMFNKPMIDDVKNDIGNNDGPSPPPFKPPVFNPASNSPPPNPMANQGGGPPPGPNAPPPNPYANESAPPPNPYAMEAAPRKLSPMERAMQSAQMADNLGMNKGPSGPPRPKMPGMKSSMLLNSIKKGQKLRKTTQVKRKIPQDNRSKLMSALRGNASKKGLKKVVKKKAVVPDKPKEPEGIFAILNRRQFVADDSDDSGSDDSGWDSDSM